MTMDIGQQLTDLPVFVSNTSTFVICHSIFVILIFAFLLSRHILS